MSDQLTIQYVLQCHLAEYTQSHRLDGQRLKVCRHLLTCHTPVLGGLRLQCDHCEHHAVHYCGCRDRHCPQCQHRASRRWSERQQQAVLPVTYYHLVFTLPHELNGWAQLHPSLMYHLLFRCAWRTLKAFAADPERLNGKLGMTAVLHTWGRNLSRHVHLHCLIPGGALGKEQQWHAAKSNYLFPVKALSRHFRGSLVSALRQAGNAGQLSRVRADDVDRKLNELMHMDWVVYSKPCLKNPESIIGYLARYTHRIAISDQRLVSLDENSVTFRYRDTQSQKAATLTLYVSEFIRRFLMHVLPGGFMRIRHYGWLANRCREQALVTIRAILAAPMAEQATTEDKDLPEMTYPCPACRQGTLRLIERILPQSIMSLQSG